MAKKKQVSKKKTSASKKKKGGKGNKVGGKLQLFIVMLLVLSIAFVSSAVILFIGLMPMFVAFFVDRSKKKTKSITVGAMNIAGCTPFLMELWTSGGGMDRALSIILDPMAIIVIYAAAGVGYIIDWAMTLVVAAILYQRGIARKKAIEMRQIELEKRWGKEVAGAMALDHEGFPLEAVVEKES